MISQNELAIKLSKLKSFEKSDVFLEQYQTPSEITAKVLWWAYMQGDIENKVIADFGCGNGILGIGALLLNAKKMYFVDKSKEAIRIAKENYKDLNLKNGMFFNKNINEFNKKVDIVIENPPFGVQKVHADKIFLEKALEISEVVYSFHKIESNKFINAFCKDNNSKAEKIFVFDFPLKATQKFHKKRVYKVKVGVWRINRKF